mmetsp:Transcript_4288/g.10454  ORF Transcript_4288/g.10454 Transcript_4288/m.10454 type:complete len:478 (+) Transcript_4288:610-2043(+)
MKNKMEMDTHSPASSCSLATHCRSLSGSFSAAPFVAFISRGAIRFRCLGRRFIFCLLFRRSFCRHVLLCLFLPLFRLHTHCRRARLVPEVVRPGGQLFGLRSLLGRLLGRREFGFLGLDLLFGHLLPLLRLHLQGRNVGVVAELFHPLIQLRRLLLCLSLHLLQLRSPGLYLLFRDLLPLFRLHLHGRGVRVVTQFAEPLVELGRFVRRGCLLLQPRFLDLSPLRFDLFLGHLLSLLGLHFQGGGAGIVAQLIEPLVKLCRFRCLFFLGLLRLLQLASLGLDPFLGDFLPLFCLHLESGRVGIVAKVVQPLVEITLLLCRLLFLLHLAPAGLDFFLGHLLSLLRLHLQSRLVSVVAKLFHPPVQLLGLVALFLSTELRLLQLSSSLLHLLLGHFLSLLCLHLQGGRVGIVAEVVHPSVELCCLFVRLSLHFFQLPTSRFYLFFGNFLSLFGLHLHGSCVAFFSQLRAPRCQRFWVVS